jgi:hypothetical protein
MFAILFIGPLLLIGILWWLLERHERRRAGEGKPRHSGLRLFFASAAILLALFSGGCSLLFGLNADGQYVTPESIAVIGGIPFLAGLLWSRVTLAREMTLIVKLAALGAVFITSGLGVVLWSLAISGSDPTVPGLAVAAVVTGAAALWLFLGKNPANPPPS